jgi:hypothetical protein
LMEAAGRKFRFCLSALVQPAASSCGIYAYLNEARLLPRCRI